MKTSTRLFFGVVALCLVASLAPCHAAPVSDVQARTAAASWLRRGDPFGVNISRAVRDVTPQHDDAGRALFHVAELEDGGYVVLSADTMVKPVVAFSGSGEFDFSGDSPLFNILALDLAQRIPAQGGLAILGAEDSPYEDEWEALLNPPKIQLLGVGAIGDVRVAPMVKSKWGQHNVDSYVPGTMLYNYSTPGNHACGCTATLGAQIMRFYEWPKDSVAGATFQCQINGSNLDIPIQGGLFNWGDMPLVPSPASSVENKHQLAIGKLTSDIAIAIRSHFNYQNSGQTSAMLTLLTVRFTDRFKYSSAKILIDSAENNANVSKHLNNAILANLDAGCPVGLGINDAKNMGHAVVADGYGFDGGTLYTHLNMGWTGSCDVWYNLPDVSGFVFNLPSNPFNYNLVNCVMYNVFTNFTGEIISGRVLAPDGLTPAVGASVIATNLTNGGAAVSAIAPTGASGVYAVVVPSPPSGQTRQWRIMAESVLGAASATANVALSVSSSLQTTTAGDPLHGYTGLFYTPTTGSVGNRWGVNLTLVSPPEPPKPPEPPRVTGFAPGVNGTWRFVFYTPAATNLIVQQKTSLTLPDWTGVSTNSYTVGVHTNTLPATADPSRFFRLLVK